jgi:hypothetical protein
MSLAGENRECREDSLRCALRFGGLLWFPDQWTVSQKRLWNAIGAGIERSDLKSEI